ncbi:hypothetical protein OF83DRAFT_938186 [Amylostereum chailletii]|nr:hypothetical protein OF83DRAFT_938186 [Amylostereum chailletii]
MPPKYCSYKRLSPTPNNPSTRHPKPQPHHHRATPPRCHERIEHRETRKTEGSPTHASEEDHYGTRTYPTESCAHRNIEVKKITLPSNLIARAAISLITSGAMIDEPVDHQGSSRAHTNDSGSCM